MKLQERNGQFTLTLPRKIIEGMDWNKGDKIIVDIAGKNKLELVRK